MIEKSVKILLGLAMCLVLAPSAVMAHGIHADELIKLIEGDNATFLISGAKHMVTGYDHLLFLFGVMFFLTKFRDIIKYVTAFTLGHSITLIIGTLTETNASPYLVDAFIAITICYKGFDNIDGFRKYLHFTPPNLLLMVFLFGLVHGFGLATRLAAVEFQGDGLIWRILSFNLGVEIGQVAALTIILLALALWRKSESFKRFATVSNILLILSGVGLFIYQLHGYFTEG